MRSESDAKHAPKETTLDVIALNHWIARSRKRSWLLPLVILVLILLALLLVFHAWSDAAEAGASVVCAIIGLLISLVFVLVPPRLFLPLLAIPARAPPHRLLSAGCFRDGVSSQTGLIPLRL